MSHAIKSVVKPVGKLINAVPGGSILADIAATAAGAPYLVPAINGASTVAKTNSLGAGFGSAAGSYLGAQLGGSLGGGLGTIGGAANNALGASAYQSLGDTLGGSLGSTASNAFSNIAGSSLGGALGGFAGNSIGGDLGLGLSGGMDQGMSGPAAFSPTRQDAQNAPSSFSGLGDLTGEQQTSNLANQGVYGGGLGPDEQSYFLNLVNRQLVDPSGQTQDMSSLQPIENSYLQQLGLGGYGNSQDLLEAISKWKQAA